MTRLAYIDYHTCGEPVRIVTGGYPTLTGAAILDKRRQARERYDHLRRAMMLEPRGHDGMYGVIPVAASHPEAAFGVLFTHNEGYSTMCGHATIALGRYVIEQGLVKAVEPVTRFAIEAPCGLLRLACEVEDGKVGDVSFESVPAFVEARDLVVPVPGYGDVSTDIAYGGAYYCILPAARFGLDLMQTPVEEIVAAAGALTDQVRATLNITHPTEPDLGFLYGTIVTDEAGPDQDSFNLCVFAERQIDRSPTGSGVTARMALDHAKGLIPAGQSRRIRSITGGTFTGRVIGPVDFPAAGAVKVEVGGRSHLSGEGNFVIEADDPLGHGFTLPRHFAEIAGS
ncbi:MULTISPECIES: proline racemase family protein [unclassified Bosea (in: a-proteobacteria)]|uniref:proline racemase family protein n=1 Tax=unclassified Bosea (in: a-proteobacteria) TaxID=2653178 RepID=UPI000F761EA5|nr:MULTISPECIES: proline racemase family protein [unclassified Bosea (in: a-proteobacteria)]AZO79536.1 proline racemase [Bosea sp. Tri-49]RXT16220.1 proline racemase [Bosea sp. Tri-39]RXT39913.1 proline racemase [Bosea sp. Tri-54]